MTSSSSSGSSDAGSVAAGPVAWYTSTKRSQTAQNSAMRPLPSVTNGSRVVFAERERELQSEQQLAIESVYTTLRRDIDDPHALTLALRALFVLLYRSGAHTARGAKQEELLSDVLNTMRLHSDDAVLASTAHLVVGLFTSVQLPPMDALQDADVEQFYDWKAARDRQLASAHSIAQRFLQLNVAKCFRSWLAATHQRKALKAMLTNWIKLELSDRWAQWIHNCVASRAMRRESWVAKAQRAHDSGEWRSTRDAAERALSLGKHLLLLAESGLPLSESDSVLKLGAYSAASALQQLQSQEKAQLVANDRALDLIESAVEAQRHYDSEVLTVSCISSDHPFVCIA